MGGVGAKKSIWVSPIFWKNAAFLAPILGPAGGPASRQFLSSWDQKWDRILVPKRGPFFCHDFFVTSLAVCFIFSSPWVPRLAFLDVVSHC